MSFMRKIYKKEKGKFEYENQSLSQQGIPSANEEAREINNRISIPFRLHNNRTIKKTLKYVNKYCTYKRPPRFLAYFRIVKKKRSNNYNSGVYKIPVWNVEDNSLEVYVGVTARNFKDRLAEHKDNLIKGNLVTALVQRAFEKDVNILW